MKNKLMGLIRSGEFQDSSNYLLSQELEFQYAKSLLTFSLAFIGGIVTLKTALAIDTPVNEGFIYAVGSALVAALLSLGAQNGIIKDLRLSRSASPLVRLYRLAAPPVALGAAIGMTIAYFGIEI